MPAMMILGGRKRSSSKSKRSSKGGFPVGVLGGGYTLRGGFPVVVLGGGSQHQRRTRRRTQRK